MHVTIFRGAKNTAPIAAEDLPWPSLCAELDGALVEMAPRKDALLAFGPYRLRDGALRGDANVVERTFIALDSDDGTEPQRYVERLAKLGLAGYVYTTPSDSDAKRKCRVCIPITEPVPPQAARAVMTAAAEMLGMQPGCGVERTLDASRIYYVGRLIGTPARQSWTIDGAPLDPGALPAPRFAWSASAPNGHASGHASGHGSAHARAQSPPRSSDKPTAGNDQADHVVPPDVLARAHAAAERMPPSIEGHGGDAALFACARELGTIVGPHYQTIREMLDVFNARCLPRWDAKKLDREARRAVDEESKLSNQSLRKVRARRERERERPEPEAPADAQPDDEPAGEPEPEPEPEGSVDQPERAAILTTPRSKNVFIFDPRIEAYEEVSMQNVIPYLRTCGADHYVDTEGPRGGELSPATIVNRNSTVVREAVADYRSPAPCLYDADSKRLLLGILCPDIPAREDPRVALWLAMLAGDELPAVKEWIASTRQDLIHRLATALCLVGPHGAGKSLFALICGRLWGAPPVELDNVAAQFNATMATCPMVLDDECKCLARRNLTTEQFRVLVQARERYYEPKGKERRMLYGAQRFVLTANDMTDLKFANALGHGAVDALTERITTVVLDDEQAECARLALDAVRLPNGDLEWDALCSHFQFIRQTTAIPDERVRFLGQSANKARARRAVVASQLEHDAALYDRLAAVATGSAPGSGPIFLEKGALWIQIKSVAENLAVQNIADKWDVSRVRRALEPIRGPHDVVWHNGAPVRAREIDLSRLVEFCELDAELVAQTVAKAEAASQGPQGAAEGK